MLNATESISLSYINLNSINWISLIFEQANKRFFFLLL